MQINNDKNSDGRKGVNSHKTDKVESSKRISIRALACELFVLFTMRSLFY